MTSLLDDLAEQILLSPAELAEALVEHERRAAALALAVAHVKERGEWAADGSVSMSAWLRDRCRLSDRDAASWVRRARFLERFSVVAEAAVTGTLSSSQLGEMQRLHRPAFEQLLAAHQSMLVGQLASLDVAATRTACTLWRQRAEALLDDAEPPVEPERSLTLTRADDGALLGRFTLDDAAATDLEQAIRTAGTYDGADEQRTVQERNGDALFDIAAFYNRHHDASGSARHHPHVSVSVHASSLDDRPEGVNDGGQRLMSPACVDTYLCDCVLHAVVRDANQMPLSFGRSRYVVPRRLFRQISARDGGCRFPGCRRPVRHCDAHHIRYWRRGGATDYANLVLLCSRHHHLVHQLDLHLKLLPDGELHVTWSDGHERTSQPRGAPPARPPGGHRPAAGPPWADG